MYLKALEIVGFKSFADRTRMEFTRGMSAIVGPNGCGKSNVSDAIRWVLGEQSAKLLRGSKMEDCIFNGTEKRKPLGMAEVSLFLSECEQALGTAFNEITVTRRVFRSGEGQYFINKTPCRLRDIQRLFMDTGVGTSSYSLMEQGRIDLILSSRPEDRREVFEEASGITKYKTDKREALRKLEQTEANLLRLADIIKEVRRQIISLQRQAGKAARYKKHQEELRRLDIYAARAKLKGLDEARTQQEQLLVSIRQAITEHQASIQQHEQITASMRERMAVAEHEAGAEQQTLMELTGKRDRAQQAVQISRRRIDELEAQAARDNSDAAGAGAELETVRQELEEIQRQLVSAEGEYESAQAALCAHTAKLMEHEQQIVAAKQSVNRLLAESMDQESRLTHIQNELQRLDNEDRHITSRRERCAAEQENLKLLLTGHEKRATELTTARAESQAAKTLVDEMLNVRQTALTEQHEHIRQTEKKLSELRSGQAAVGARMEMLERNIKAQSGFSKTARQLLDQPGDVDAPPNVLGALAAQIEAAPEYRTALETVLRAWLDAIVVTDMPAALDCLRRLEPEAQDALRLLAVQVPTAAPAPVDGPPPPGAEKLRPHVTAPAALTPLLDRMLAGVWVLEDLAALPPEPHPAAIYVTRTGVLVCGDGHLEIHRGGARESSPLAHKHLLTEQREQLDATATQITALQSKLAAHTERRCIIEQEVQVTRTDLTEKQQTLARQEGECHLVEQQAASVRQNLETVAWEMRELGKQGVATADKSALIEAGDKIRERRLEIRRQIEVGQQTQARLEDEQKRLAAEAAAAQVQFGKREVVRTHMQSRRQPLAERMQQLQKTVAERRARGVTYDTEIAEVNQCLRQAQTDLPQLESEIEHLTARLAEIQTLREQMQTTAKTADGELHGLRAEIETLTRGESETNGKCVEQRMQRQYLIERVTGEYRISADAIQVEPEPEWPEGQRPDLEAVEITVAELRAKLDSMGPVNTEAIAEYKEQEERYEFLNGQQDDLFKSKQQLLEMIKQINQTTTEMFAGTFAAINENFQSVFKQLFGGGSAKLMLTDEEDVLECGIEIIARPPGKKLQSVSLMSGGERTMTAVALLFAIFMVKPSPFCVLDELDAALDESNIHRFIKVLRGFTAKSQFIVITHNRATISAADVLYGVTMAETGVSKIVSMRFVGQDAAPQPTPAQDEQPAPADAPTDSDVPRPVNDEPGSGAPTS